MRRHQFYLDRPANIAFRSHLRCLTPLVWCTALHSFPQHFTLLGSVTARSEVWGICGETAVSHSLPLAWGRCIMQMCRPPHSTLPGRYSVVVVPQYCHSLLSRPPSRRPTNSQASNQDNLVFSSILRVRFGLLRFMVSDIFNAFPYIPFHYEVTAG